MSCTTQSTLTTISLPGCQTEVYALPDELDATWTGLPPDETYNSGGHKRHKGRTMGSPEVVRKRRNSIAVLLNAHRTCAVGSNTCTMGTWDDVLHMKKQNGGVRTASLGKNSRGKRRLDYCSNIIIPDCCCNRGTQNSVEEELSAIQAHRDLVSLPATYRAPGPDVVIMIQGGRHPKHTALPSPPLLVSRTQAPLNHKLRKPCAVLVCNTKRSYDTVHQK
eukprot:Ihof_evm5s269 gene=Ihof_evmTU5s269